MASPIEWVRMILKNHVAFLAIWAAVFGLAGYTAYRDVPREPEIEVKLALPNEPTVTLETLTEAQVRTIIEQSIQEYDKEHRRNLH